ncbi:arylsulfatase A-like enzyme [Pedobacter sp. CAN_A7]
MAGIESPSVSQEVDGISFVSLLKVEPYAHKDRSLIWYNPHKWTATDGPGINYFSAIRQGNWKLIYDFKKEKLELYDYSQDIGEHGNLIRKHRATALKLAKSLTTQLKAWNVVLPTYKSTGKSLPWPDEKAHSLSL